MSGLEPSVSDPPSNFSREKHEKKAENEVSADGGGGNFARSIAIKAACIIGGAYLLRRLTKQTTQRDHTKTVSGLLSGEKFSTDQASKDPGNYFNLRLDACPATELADASKLLYYEQAFCRAPDKPFRQRFYLVKPCPKDMKCDVEVGTYAIRDTEEYRNFCERPKNQRPLPEEAAGDMSEHITTVYMSKCERGRKCLYEGSTPPGGFPSTWNGATTSTSELTIFKSGELHVWDRGYNDDGNQVWGPLPGPCEFKPKSQLTSNALSEFVPKKSQKPNE